MQTTVQSKLFTDLSAEEAANVNGAGSNYYYYSPYNYEYTSYPSYGYYGGCGYYGGGYYGGGYYGSGSSNPSVNQTVNVNVQVKD